jgi:hypothetical protein
MEVVVAIAVFKGVVIIKKPRLKNKLKKMIFLNIFEN